MDGEISLKGFRVGEKTVSPGRTITEADIVIFVGISGDWTELHTNAEYMKSSPFGQRIAHGMLTLSIASGLAFGQCKGINLRLLHFSD